MADITSLSKKLKKLISKYEHSSFLTHWSFLANMHYRNKRDGKSDLLSPVRQIMYIISLYHSTEMKGKKHFEAFGKEYKTIVSLLNQIEKTYSTPPVDLYTQDEKTAEIIFISNTTFLNYYLNAPLSYMEQDIERIRRTFIHFEPYIIEECGLSIEDFIQFYILISDLEIDQYNNYYNHTLNEKKLIIKASKSHALLTDEEKIRLIELADKAIIRLAIPITKIKEFIASEKVDLLLSFFTLIRDNNEEYLYYTDPCPYLTKPLLLIDTAHIVLVYSKQLINAIYDFLFDLCTEIDGTGRRVFCQRENYLEYKTEEIFKEFFGSKAIIHSNYVINFSEKDILILLDNCAFIVECKANKYRIPFRDPIKAYERIKDDFKKSIGKAHVQSKEVQKYFSQGQKFEIRDEKGKLMDTINPESYKQVFSIIVTQERFGQIQCNLGHLLDTHGKENFPWAVSLDDLETFLITLNRKTNHIQEFITYLKLRQKLHDRLYCFDELELCATFLMHPPTFEQYCNHTMPLLTQGDMNLFFDELYSVGFGFKDELNIKEKPYRDLPIATALIKELKLLQPLRMRNT